MERFFGCTFTAILVVGLIGFSGSGTFNAGECLAADGPVVMMGTPLVKADKNAKVVIMGTGFKPGREVKILISSPEGQLTNIDEALDPAPKADATGTWATTWNAGSYVSKKVVPPGACKVIVSDAEYNPIAHSVVFFQKEAKKDKEK